MKKDEQRIRELAYDIWVSEGRPHGQDERHWEMARKLAEAESGNPAAEKPASRARKTATKPPDATPARLYRCGRRGSARSAPTVHGEWRQG